MNKRININRSLITSLQWKTLHTLAVAKRLTAGRGYMDIKDFVEVYSEFCGCSVKTVQRKVKDLKEHQLISLRRGRIHIKGNKRLKQMFHFDNMNIQFEDCHLKLYSEFRNHIIRQLALAEQRAMGYSIVKDKKSIDPASLIQSGKVANRLAVVKNSKKVGCSLSRLVEKYGFDKMTVSRALKGYTTKQYGQTLPINGKVVRVKYKDIIDGTTGDYRWSYTYNKRKDTYVIRYSLASRINVESYIRRTK